MYDILLIIIRFRRVDDEEDAFAYALRMHADSHTTLTVRLIIHSLHYIVIVIIRAMFIFPSIFMRDTHAPDILL